MKIIFICPTCNGSCISDEDVRNHSLADIIVKHINAKENDDMNGGVGVVINKDGKQIS